MGALMTATGDDLTIQFDPHAMLGLPAAAHGWFRTAMLTDTFGFYLPFLVIGGYLWSRLRGEGGAPVDMAVLFLGFYVVLGVLGAMLQYGALPDLAHSHLSADPIIRVSSESAWAATVTASQHGLWALEGPVLVFWTAVMGPLLRRNGWGRGRLLEICGYLYVAVYDGGLFGIPEATLEPVSTLAVVLLPIWMMLFGSDLLRGRG